MRITSFFIPVIVFIVGVLGFALRLTELASVFDPVSGLPERNALITLVLIGFSTLIFLVAFIFAVSTSVRYVVSADYDDAFGTDSFAYPAIYTALCTIWLVATVVYFLELFSLGDMALIDKVFTIASSLSAIFLMIFAIEVYKNPRRKFLALLSIVPTLFMCFWLILIYMDNASNPVLLGYAYKCLAFVFCSLGLYFSTGFSIGKPVIGKAILSYTGATYFCMITLADDYSLSIKLIIGTIAIMNLFNLGSLIRNLQRKIKTS